MTMLVCFSVLVFVVILGSCSKNIKYPGVKDEFTIRGLNYYYDMDWDSALTQFNEAIKINTGIAEAHAGLGKVYYAYAEYNRSIEEFMQAAKYKPKYMYFVRGIQDILSGNYDAAISEFSNAIKDKFETISAYDFRASLYNTKGEYDKAIADYNFILKASSDFLFAYIGRGNSYVMKMDFYTGLADIDEAIKRNPNSFFSRVMRGMSYYSQSELEKGFGNQDRANDYLKIALDDFDYILSIDPIYIAHYWLIGTVYNCNENYDEAVKYFSEAIKMDPNFSTAYNSRGDSYNKSKQYDLALDDQNTAISLNPNFTEAYSSRADVYFEKGNIDQAIEDYKHALQINPNHGITYMKLIVFYFNQLDFKNAENMAREIIRISPNSFLGYYFLGLISNINQNPSQALVNHTKALQLAPDSESIKDNIRFFINSIQLSAKTSGENLTFYMIDGKEYSRGKITGTGSGRRIRITHLYDRNKDALIPIEEYLKHSSELGVSDKVLNFFEEQLNNIEY